MRFAAWPLAILWLLLPPLLWLVARALRRRGQLLAALLDRPAAARLLRAGYRQRPQVRAVCLLAALACLILALMQPQWGRSSQDLPLEGRDLVVLLDTSLSMLATDVQPSRLAAAKAAIRGLVEAVRRDGGHRLALVTFAGRADIRCPPTRDYALFLRRLEAATVEDVGARGTVIGNALGQAARDLGTVEAAFTDFILVSDGEDHGGLAIEAARLLPESGLTLYTAGVGSPDRDSLVPLGSDGRGLRYLVHAGQEVRTRLQPGLLTGIAAAGGGRYVAPTAGTPDLAGLYRAPLASQPKRPLASGQEPSLQHRFQLFALLAILLLAGDLALAHWQPSRWSGWRPRRAGSVALGAALVWPLFGDVERADEAVRAGNRHYQAGAYEAALERYAAAEALRPATPEIAFDRGNVWFRQHDYDRALEAYLAALGSEDARLRASASYNIGVIKFRQAMAVEHSAKDALSLTEAAVRYYRDSLAVDASRVEARYNLELAYKLLREVRQALRQQQAGQTPPAQTTFKRGQELSDRIRNEGGGQRRARADSTGRTHGERGNEAPENFADNEQQQQAKGASMPVAMNPDAAGQLMQQLMAKIEAGESWRREKRRAQLEAPGEGRPW